MLCVRGRVNLPKSFVAVNLSDAFSFPEKHDGQEEKEQVKGEEQTAQ
jgi:hypothetical protein